MPAGRKSIVREEEHRLRRRFAQNYRRRANAPPHPPAAGWAVPTKPKRKFSGRMFLAPQDALYDAADLNGWLTTMAIAVLGNISSGLSAGLQEPINLDSDVRRMR
jgi:hypothetical protein